MAITTSTIIGNAAKALLDDTHVRWSENELLSFLNDGQLEIVLIKPDANSVNTKMEALYGTKQTIPSDGIILLEVIRNMGVGGNSPGRAITRIKRKDIDVTDPSWHTTSMSAETKHYIFEEQDPKNFYVYPSQPSSGRGWIEYVYSKTPVETNINSFISLDDVYKTPLLYYILFRAYSKDTEAGSSTKAAGYYQAFITSVTGKAAGEATTPLAPKQ